MHISELHHPPGTTYRTIAKLPSGVMVKTQPTQDAFYPLMAYQDLRRSFGMAKFQAKHPTGKQWQEIDLSQEPTA